MLFIFRYLAKSFHFILPYFPTGTMERVDTEGQIATAKVWKRKECCGMGFSPVVKHSIYVQSVYNQSFFNRVISNYVRKERNVLLNDALNVFYLRLYGIRRIVKDHSDSERGNLLPSHGLLFPISSKGSFICIIPQTG